MTLNRLLTSLVQLLIAFPTLWYLNEVRKEFRDKKN